MQLNIPKYLFDIQTSIDSIYEYLGEQRSFDVYMNNKQLQRSVERELEIIGEAMNKILQLDSNIAIANAHKIIGLRNRVIHAYDNVDNEIVWGVIVKHLPVLKNDVTRLLSEI